MCLMRTFGISSLLGGTGASPRRIAGCSEGFWQTGSRLRAAGQVTSGPYKSPGQHQWPSFGTPTGLRE